MEKLKLAQETYIDSDFIQKLIIFIQLAFGKVDWQKKCRIEVEFNPEEKKSIIKVYKYVKGGLTDGSND